jgi:hypothetical protein
VVPLSRTFALSSVQRLTSNDGLLGIVRDRHVTNTRGDRGLVAEGSRLTERDRASSSACADHHWSRCQRHPTLIVATVGLFIGRRSCAVLRGRTHLVSVQVGDLRGTISVSLGSEGTVSPAIGEGT